MKKLALLCLTATALSGCDWVLGLAKEGALSLTARSGPEHFTLAGELPANFMLQATTKYSAVNPEHCQTYSIGLGRDVTRQSYEQYDTGYADQSHGFSVEIPLTQHIGRCTMQAYQVSFRIRGRYGDKDWQAHSSTGGIGITAIQPTGAPTFSPEGTATMRGACTWLFQMSKAKSRLGEISKLLICSETDENWQLAPDMIDRRGIGETFGRDELPGKTVYLEIREDSEERPSHRNTWIKFPEGWKPCEPKAGGWISCQDPPIFKTFEMNGKKCTVYPDCKEQ